MPYIGVDINYGNIAKQTGTGDGSDTTPIAALTYTVPSNESILVFLDGVAQVPGTDFSATGTTLTFTTAPALGVAILVMFLGRSLDIGTPGDSTVTLAKMAANSIDSDQYVDGSIDAVHLSANSVDSDAYVDGSIDLAHMSSESVDEDNLHISNSGSNGQFLSKQSGDTGGLTWAAAGDITDSKFLAKITSARSNVTGDNTLYTATGAIWTETFDTGSDFVNGTFTAPETGKYILGCLIQVDGLTSNHTRSSLKIVTSNRSFWVMDRHIWNEGAGVSQVRFTECVVCDMDASDTAYITIQITATDKTVDVQVDTSFYGALLG
jgi:hypothetical protein